jgi:hypothetical protein
LLASQYFLVVSESEQIFSQWSSVDGVVDFLMIIDFTGNFDADFEVWQAEWN